MKVYGWCGFLSLSCGTITAWNILVFPKFTKPTTQLFPTAADVPCTLYRVESSSFRSDFVLLLSGQFNVILKWITYKRSVCYAEFIHINLNNRNNFTKYKTPSLRPIISPCARGAQNYPRLLVMHLSWFNWHDNNPNLFLMKSNILCDEYVLILQLKWSHKKYLFSFDWIVRLLSFCSAGVWSILGPGPRFWSDFLLYFEENLSQDHRPRVGLFESVGHPSCCHQGTFLLLDSRGGTRQDWDPGLLSLPLSLYVYTLSYCRNA